MIKKILLLILTIIIISCQSKTDTNYAEDLKNCLTDDDVKLLNIATELFENKLTEHYGNESTNQNYISYLSDMSEINTTPAFPRDFFFTSKSIEIISDFEKVGTFEKIWMPYVEEDNEFEEEIPITSLNGSEEPKEKPLELNVINPNGEYLKCMLKSNETEIMTDVIQKMAEFGNLSPSLTSGALKSNLQASDFENSLNKVAVAIGFYYEFVNTIYKNQK